MHKLSGRMQSGNTLIVGGAYDGISAHLVERSGFDAIWVSGFCVCSSKFISDESVISAAELIERTAEIIDATKLPVIVDCDEGYGSIGSCRRLARKLLALGAAGICIEDNPFPKTNSFQDQDEGIALAPVDCQVRKLREIKSVAPDLTLIARTEALIRTGSLESALERLGAYAAAGADAVVLHSRFTKLADFASIRQAWREPLPLVVIPTKCTDGSFSDFRRLGFSMVIYANHAFRASAVSISNVLHQIRNDARTDESSMMPMEYFFGMFGDQTSTQGGAG